MKKTDNSGEVAGLMVKESIWLIEAAVKMLVARSKSLVAFLMALSQNNKKLYDKINIARLFRTGREFKTFHTKESDPEDFRAYAKKNVLFPVIRNTRSTSGIMDFATNMDYMPLANRYPEQRNHPAPTQEQEGGAPRKVTLRVRLEHSSPQRRSGSTAGQTRSTDMRTTETTEKPSIKSRLEALRAALEGIQEPDRTLQTKGKTVPRSRWTYPRRNIIMANLEAIIVEKSQQSNQWRTEMQADRENTIAIQNTEMEETTNSPKSYVKYLDIQGDNPTYSVGNVTLIMFQDPEATVLSTAERWKTLNWGVMDQERSRGAEVLARSTLGRGCCLTDAYDIRQTQGRDLKKVQLKDDSKEMSIVLRVALNYPVAPATTDHDLPMAAYYDSKSMELVVDPTFSDSKALAAIAAGVAHSRIYTKRVNPDYNREEVDPDAQSIPYILCHQFGIKRDTPDLPCLEELYKGWNPQQ